MRSILANPRSSMLKDTTLRQSIRQRQLTGRLTARQRPTRLLTRSFARYLSR